MRFFARHPADSDLITGLKADGLPRRQSEDRLYQKYRYLITDGVRKHRLDEDECASAYSDTILTVIENVRGNRFEGHSELSTYIYQIFTNKCIDLIRKKSSQRSQVHNALSLDDSLLQLPDSARSIVQQLIAQSDLERLRGLIAKLGDKCREMILAWGEGYSDEEIARQMNYNTASVAKTSRLRCLERLRELYR
ncbi:RNA polymerase sigma factor [Larkinella terrae]|uniref:Sigma-70 family RNA polymerase sigma factor n=1 Tax=Larkinella terrae TaxID=2025311 RepID=A0A7K0ELG0_9BACT|nr:sigma-70 family RNA polymerase sigma factor [Larkinella terrae]MRS62615.1 sigma-70 family RNA polymerase sigma factor [Larkinella terrae]